ncbi:cytochrome c [Rhizobacter sp. AJA081-3]|uniref:c-type cytochrome n=1 Tax=Rhizobacter sp. AJA081-3 TaxID=2753607 RepID=UPI001ADFF3F9|nr:cytochrome c [Rhizobacter sp. AJA081-3]QTN24503.1 cytochrome c [Rhizobacter sp. AJA081-3]
MKQVLPLLLAAALPGAAVAGDASAGRLKAQACSVCHGPVGIAVAPETPNLAGEPEGYIVRQLRAFRTGKRQHEVMNVIAKPLSDEDIDNVAAWFASIRITATAP